MFGHYKPHPWADYVLMGKCILAALIVVTVALLVLFKVYGRRGE